MIRPATIAALVLLCSCTIVGAQGPASAATAPAGGLELPEVIRDAGESAGPSGTVKAILAVTILAIAPAMAIMVTCFTRIIVVLGLLRQALGTQQLPPNQILFGLALFMTVVVMSPVISEVYDKAVLPYSNGQMSQIDAWNAGKTPIRNFMIRQIEEAGNSDDVYLFLSEAQAAREDLTWRDVGTQSLIPAFAVSELKTAFMMGFRIYLPFVIVDMLVASVLLSMGMLMLPPVLVSLPFKLLLFVLADGWHIVVGGLMKSFV